MTAFSVLILLCICALNYVESNTIEGYVNHVCGGINSCNSGGNNYLPSDSCCRPCECNDICHEKGTCCYGIIPRQVGNVTRQACLPSVSYSRTYGDTRQFPSYYVRDHCPPGYVGELTRYKCESDKPESLLDIAFVSTKDGTIIYKNRHCAACFGQSDVIMWKLVVDWYCIKAVFLDDEWTLLNSSFVTEKLMAICTLSFEPSDTTKWKNTLCFQNENLFSSCPESSTLKLYPRNLTEAFSEMCSNDKSSLTFFKSGSSAGYANVYCYLCSKGTKVTCDPAIPDKPGKTTTDISFLLRIPPITDASKAGAQQNGCHQHEYFDKYFDVCRRLRCPQFEVPFQGKCRSITESGILNYAFHFKIHPVLTLMWQNDEINEFFAILPREIQKYLQFEYCAICSASVKSEGLDISRNSEMMFLLEIVFTSALGCEREKMLSTAAKLERETASEGLVIVIRKASFHMEYIWSAEKYKNDTRNLDTIYRLKQICPYFSPSKFDNCPKIAILSDNNCCKSTNEFEMANKQLTGSEDRGFEICVDDYEACQAEMSHGRRMMFTSVPMILFWLFSVVLLA